MTDPLPFAPGQSLAHSAIACSRGPVIDWRRYQRRQPHPEGRWHVRLALRSSDDPENGAESVLTSRCAPGRLPAEIARWSTINQIYEGTNQIQRMVMARQLLKR